MARVVSLLFNNNMGQHTLLSLPSAAIRSAHSLEYSKLRSALSMLLIYWRYFASAMSFCSSKSVSADSMAMFSTESIASPIKRQTRKKKWKREGERVRETLQLKTTIKKQQKSITINKHLLPLRPWVFLVDADRLFKR